MKKNTFYILLVSMLVLMFYEIAFAALIRTIKQVETNQPGYVEKSVKIKGEIDVSTKYRHGYRHAQNTHFAFKLVDHTGTAYLYVEKDKKRAVFLRKEILSKNEPVKGDFVIRIMEDKYKKYKTYHYDDAVYADLRVAYYQEPAKFSKPRVIRSSRTTQITNNKPIYRSLERNKSSSQNIIIKMQESKPILLNKRDPNKGARTNQDKVEIKQRNYSDKIYSWVDEEGRMHFSNAD